MRVLRTLALLLFSISLVACIRPSGCTDLNATNFEPDAFYDDGSCNYGNQNNGNGNGGYNVTFYNNQSSVGLITVSISGYSSDISVTSIAADCGESGCANFSLGSGTYSFTASATTGEYWSDFITVTSGCSMFELY
jgi:hypothetical protein